MQSLLKKIFLVLNFGHLNLFRISNFEFRISSQKFKNFWLVLSFHPAH